MNYAQYSTFTSVEVIDGVVDNLFNAMNEFRVFWNVYNEEEKKSFINRAYDEIAGFFANACCILDVVPNDVLRRAIAYNSLGVMNAEFLAVADKQQQTLQSLGAVKNLRLDQSSARLMTAQETGAKSPEIPLASRNAYKLLKPYMTGFVAVKGVRI